MEIARLVHIEGEREARLPDIRMRHWSSARSREDEDEKRASRSVIYIFGLTCPLVLNVQLISFSLISSSTARLSDMSVISPLGSGTPCCQLCLEEGCPRWQGGKVARLELLLSARKGKDGRDDSVSHRSEALAFLSFKVSGIGQDTCYLRYSVRQGPLAINEVVSWTS